MNTKILKIDAVTGAKYLDTMVTFQKMMAFESEGMVLNEEVLKAGISKALSNVHLGQYYIAVDKEDRLQGMLLAISEWSDWRCSSVLWIHSVYIDKPFRRSGIYSQMYEQIKAEVEASQSFCGIRLYVDKGNEAAIKVYQKLDMNDDHYTLFEWLKD